ncbi:MAG: hypothetical protein SFW66_06695 [Gammaproteobacteria bacterium]|nr:hypothetical protein [Gammaproteobacteria bacterium]
MSKKSSHKKVHKEIQQVDEQKHDEQVQSKESHSSTSFWILGMLALSAVVLSVGARYAMKTSDGSLQPINDPILPPLLQDLPFFEEKPIYDIALTQELRNRNLYDLCTAPDVLEQEEQVVLNARELHEKIGAKIIAAPNAYNEGEEKLFAADRDQLIESITQLYLSGGLEQCKIDALLNWDEFKIVIDVGLPCGDGDFCYLPNSYSVHLKAGCRDINLNTLGEVCSHELEHAVNGRDNFHNEVYFFVGEDNTRLDNSFNYGFFTDHKIDKSDYNDFVRVEKMLLGVEQRIRNLSEAIDLLNKPKAQRNNREMQLMKRVGKDIQIFFKLIKDSHYRPAIDYSRYQDDTTERLKKSGFGDWKQNAKLPRAAKDIMCDMPYAEFHNTDSSVFYRADEQALNTCGTRELAKSFLIVMERSIDHVKNGYPKSHITTELDAFITQRAYRYPELFKFIARELWEHQISRATPERAECLRKAV